MNVIFECQNNILRKSEIMENKPLGVPDVVFMIFTSGIFSSKTLVSI